MFIVIEIELDSYEPIIYDSKFLNKFSDHITAENYIKELEQKRTQSWVEKCKYNKNYVENIQIPELDYKEWTEWIKDYPVGSYICPKTFKNYLELKLNEGYSIENKDYNPPTLLPNRDYIIVEIPCQI